MPNLFNPLVDDKIKDAAISRTYRRRVIDQALVEPTVANSYLAKALPRQRAQIFFIAVLVVSLIFLARSGYLQLVRGDEFLSLADRNRIHIEYLPSARGLFYDTTGQALVQNEPNFVASIVPSELPNVNTADYSANLEALAKELKLQTNELDQSVRSQLANHPTEPLMVREFIPPEEARPLFITARQIRGLQIEVQSGRNYLTTPAFAHVLGYLGKISPEDLERYTSDNYSLVDTVGKSGLESWYETNLHGIKGERQIEINAQGEPIDTLTETVPVAGTNLVLSIDAKLQQLLYDSLAEVSNEVASSGGAAVALDPRTGQIRALVSYPAFDNNLFSRGISTEDYQQLVNDDRKPLFNKAISGEYPTGSIFKLIVAAAALQEGVVTESTVVQSTGGIQLDKLYRDWKTGGHGATNIYKALAESVNTYFYIAGGGTYDSASREITGGLGVDRINAYALKFGLDEPSGLDLPGEAAGFVPSREWRQTVIGEPWYLGDTYLLSIGQGDLRATPLQVALVTSVVANGGTLYQPSLVERMTNQAGETVSQIEPKIVRQNIVAPQYLAVVRSGMRQAVSWGSARRMNSLPVTSAGKTGTAQIGGKEQTHSWYTTFLPYDQPELVLTVLVEEGGEGSAAALTVAQEVLMKYLTG